MFENTEIINFIHTLYGNAEKIPLHEPVFSGNEKEYLAECIDSTFVSSVGKYVGLFEEKISEYTKASYAVATVNGTAALHLALLIAGVQSSDQVLTQPLTFVATANAIAYLGAEPVFIDVDLDTMGMSPQKLREFLENETIFSTTSERVNRKTGKRISACVPMHTFGHPCRIDEIVEICNEFNIPVVEDAAESIGSYYKGKHTGTFGRIGIFSFNGNKTITTGGGGMLVTNDEGLAREAKHLSTQAKINHPWEYAHDCIGYNYRLPNINAALGVAQMERLDEIIIRKRRLAEKYAEFFGRNDSPVFFKEPENAKSNYWLNALIFKTRAERDLFLNESNEAGVMTRPIWQLMPKLNAFKTYQSDDIQNSLWLEERVVNISSSINYEK